VVVVVVPIDIQEDDVFINSSNHHLPSSLLLLLLLHPPTTPLLCRGVEETMDISGDLQQLSRTPLLVVCAGAKSILDLPKTLEHLETLGQTGGRNSGSSSSSSSNSNR